MKKFTRPLIFLVIVIVALAIAGSKIRQNSHKEAPAPRVSIVRRGDVSVLVSEVGTLEPVSKVDVKSKVAGRLLTIPIQEGQFVHTGQLIATVDRTLIDPQVAQTQASLQQAQARLQQTVSEYRLQVAQSAMAISQAQANLAEAKTHLAAVRAGARPQELAQQQQAVERTKIALADAQRTLTRKKDLVAKGFVAQADLDTAQTNVDTAQSNLASAQQQLDLTQAGPRIEDIRDAQSQVSAQKVALATAEANAAENEVRKSDITQAQASVEQTAGNLAQLLVNLHDTRIVAPASGVVLKKYKEPTEIIQSATTGFSDSESIVATLGTRSLVRVGINEVDIPKVRLGDPVNIHVDAISDKIFSGVVTEIAPASTNAFDSTGASTSSSSSISKFSVKIEFRQYDPRLRPGMSAGVDIISARHKNVSFVALEAVPFSGSHGNLSVLLANKKQEPRAVTTGLRNDQQVEIVSGLKDGDAVVIPAIDGKARRKLDIQFGN